LKSDVPDVKRLLRKNQLRGSERKPEAMNLTKVRCPAKGEANKREALTTKQDCRDAADYFLDNENIFNDLANDIADNIIKGFQESVDRKYGK
jgi:hypothetical protein